MVCLINRVAYLVLRSRVILLAAERLENKQIAKKLKVAPRMATLRRDRFNKLGIKGLLKDAARTLAIDHRGIDRSLIEKTTQSTPANATHWSTRSMAKEMGISKASVSRIWRFLSSARDPVPSSISNLTRFRLCSPQLIGTLLTVVAITRSSQLCSILEFRKS